MIYDLPMDWSRRDLLIAGAAAAIAPPWKTLMTQQTNEPLPSDRVARFESMAFGMFLHFGLYSKLGRGEWVMHQEKIPREEYMKLMDGWDVPNFSGRAIGKLCREAGAKYATMTSRHHDGFSLYDTHGLCPWDVTKTPAGRDIVRDFVDGCRAEGVLPMLYHTTLDWSDPRFENDWKGYQQYLRDSVEIICSNYGPLGGIWFDGNWSKREADWELDALYAVVRKHQPEAMLINNTGIEEGGRLVHKEIDAVTFERGRPEPIQRKGMEKYVAGEMCHTCNFHWGTGSRDFNFLSPGAAIEELCRSRGAGANLLLNLGPLGDGSLPAYESELFRVMGQWIRLHGGDAGPVYKGRVRPIRGEGEDFGLAVGDDLYLFVFELTATGDTRATGVKPRGAGDRPFTGIPEGYTQAVWMDSGAKLKLEHQGDGKSVLGATGYPYGTNTVVRVARLTRG